MIAIVAMALLLAWRHAANISRLLAGTESRLGRSAPDLRRRRS